jgi:hypothetical protein
MTNDAAAPRSRSSRTSAPGAIRPWVRRAVRRRALLAAVAVLVAVLAVLAALATAIAVRAPTEAAREALLATPDRLASVTIAVDADPARADRVFRGLVRDAFGSAPVTVDRTVHGQRSTWTVRPRVQDLDAGDLPDLTHGFATLPDAASLRFAPDGGTLTSGSGTRTSATLLAGVIALRSALPVPVVVLTITGGVALTMLARLLVTARRTEDDLFRARGATAGMLVGAAAVEVVVVAVPAAVVGTVLGVLPTTGAWGPPTGAAELVLPGLAVVVLATLTVSGVAVLGTATKPLPRAPLAVSLPAVALLVAVAALAVWRFRSAPAEAATDPLAVLAPAAALTAFAVAATVVLGFTLRRIAGRVGPRQGVVLSLGSRLAARDLGASAPAATLLVLAVATGVLTAGTTATSTAFLHDSSLVTAGGSLRATTGDPGPVDSADDLLPTAARTASIRGHDTTPVVRFTGGTPTGSAEVLGVDHTALPRLLDVAPRTFDAVSVSDALSGTRVTRTAAGLFLGTGRLAMTTTTTTSAIETTPLAITAWVVDAVGDLAPVPLRGGSVPAAAAQHVGTVTGSLPAGGPWRLVAVDLTVRPTVLIPGMHIAVTGIRVGTHVRALPARPWSLADAFDPGVLQADAGAGPLAVGTDDVLGVEPGGIHVRLVPSGGRTVPVVASAALVADASVHVGSSLPLSGPLAGFAARIVAVVPVVPGTTGGPAVLADLTALDGGMLAAAEAPPAVREVWAAHTDQRAELRRTLGAGARVERPTSSLEAGFLHLDGALLLLAAGGGLAFALLALGVTVTTARRNSDGETTALRAVGVRARDQGRIRATVPTVVVAHGLLGGLLGGGLAAGLLVAPTARANVPDAPAGLPVHTALDPVLSAVVLVVAVVVGGAVVLVHAATTARTARRADRRA